VRERLGKRGISDVELKFGATGQFDVFIDDRLAFSKATEGRFPTDGEIDQLTP
jgi:predicted Rdx family selenoprotein